MTPSPVPRVDRVVALRSDPPFLGGAPPRALRKKIPSGMYYSQLSRPARLPEAQCPSTTKFATVEGERIFRKLHDGDFTFWWVEIIEKGMEGMQILVLRSDSLNRPEISDANKWMGFQLVITPIHMGGRAFLSVDFNSLKPLFNNKQRQLEELSTRVLHRIYRCIASRLNSCNCEMLFQQLKKQYDSPQGGSKGNRLASVDIHLTFCDASFYQGHHDMTKRLVEVGEALEAAERFSDAAKVYEDVTRNLNRLSNSSECYDVITQSYAGLAYKRAGFLDKAEASYLEALRSDLKRNGIVFTGRWLWNVNDNIDPVSTSLLWSNFIMNYHAQLEEAFLQAGSQCISFTQDTARSMSVLIGLLTVAGYRPSSHLVTLFRQQAPKVRPGLREKSPDAAIDTLASIIHCSKKPSQFRTHLKNCLIAGKHAELSLTFSRNRPTHSAKNDKANAPKEMKRALFPQCNNPACTHCRNAQYSVSLKRAIIALSCFVVLLAVQIARWEIHKKS